MSRSTRSMHAVAAVALALLLAACGASGTSSSQPTRTMTIVGLEMAFRGPSQAGAGTYEVTFKNEGLLWHELAFKDASGTFVARRSIAPGQSMTFPVKLKAGTYELGCYEPGHYERGMHQSLLVS